MFKRSVQEILLHPDNELNVEDFHKFTEGELVSVSKMEQQRLDLVASAELLSGTIFRRLYKVGAVLHPGDRKQSMMVYLDDLYHNPEKRRLKEIELCNIFSKKLGRRLCGHEILIDIPGFNKSPEVDLKVFYGKDIPSDKQDPLTFDDLEVTRLRDSLLHNFEDQAKIFRIFCINDTELRQIVSEEVKQFLF